MSKEKVSSFSKKKVLDYCEKFVRIDFEHICAAQDNFRAIKEERYSDLAGCPSGFGLDDYVGLCELETEEVLEKQSYTDACDMCEKCWKQALGVDRKEKIQKAFDKAVEQNDEALKKLGGEE